MSNPARPQPDRINAPLPPAVSAVLWDIDGTLLRSGGHIARAFLDAVQTVCGNRPDPSGLDFGGRLDPDIAALLVTAAGGQPDQVPDAIAEYEALVTRRQGQLRPHVEALPGVLELMATLSDAGVTQTVVTGNLESVGSFKLEAAALIPPIDISVAGFATTGSDRTAVAQVALDRLSSAGRLGPLDTCWVVGDTPRDLACARALGLRCALVATGRHTVEALGALGPDLVLTSLTEDALLRRAWFG